MGTFHFVLLVGAALSVKSDGSCNGRDGENGSAGRGGLPGMKGQKGEPAVRLDGPVDPSMLLRLKGERGNPGPQGPIGHKGYLGELGAPGMPGQAGPPGPVERRIDSGQHSSSQQDHSAFSVLRTDSKYPPLNQKITFQTAAVNKYNDFNISTGTFTCRVPGFYYFAFHSVAKVSMCLALVREGEEEEKQVFCDHNKRFVDQVLSGGVVLELTRGQKVWLESYADQQIQAHKQHSREKQIAFNGFLIFSNSE